MQAAPDDEVMQWLYQKLSSNTVISNYVGNHPNLSTLKAIYSELAPENAEAPMIVFRIISAIPKVGAQGLPVFWRYSLMVELIVEGLSIANSSTVFKEIQNTIHQDQVDGLETVVSGCHVVQILPSQVEIMPGGIRRTRRIIQAKLQAYRHG